jgi:hypothetical protein
LVLPDAKLLTLAWTTEADTEETEPREQEHKAEELGLVEACER